MCTLSVYLKEPVSLGSQPVVGTESASRPDPLQRAGALGDRRQLRAAAVEDAEGGEVCAGDEEVF